MVEKSWCLRGTRQGKCPPDLELYCLSRYDLRLLPHEFDRDHREHV
jgi:hypothetical protein